MSSIGSIKAAIKNNANLLKNSKKQVIR